MTYQETAYQKVHIVDSSGNIVDSFGGGVNDKGSGATTVATTRVVAATDSPEVARLMPSSGTLKYENIGTSVSNSIKASSGIVYYFIINNFTTSPRYLFLVDSTTVPAANSTPTSPPYTIPANGILAIGQNIFGGGGKLFGTGISYGISTTPLTYTAATNTDCTVEMRYQ